MIPDSSYLDLYCERAGSHALLGEPLNALTNLAFIAAALWLWRVYRRDHPVFRSYDTGIVLLIGSLTLIGIGSGLWHLFANRQTMLADVIPISIFINVYLVTCLRQMFRLPWLGVFLGWLLYNLASYAASVVFPPDALNGSVLYFPAVMTLILIVMGANRIDHRHVDSLAAAVAIFLLSITLRTIDVGICSRIPIGTHFLWHLLNAAVLAILVRTLLYDRRAA